MKRIYNFVILSVWAMLTVCCSSEEPIQAPVKVGEEVKFGLSLDNGTRTVYGPETNNAFPIYWTNGDKVQIYSPECSEGRNDAEYSVTPKSGESYAEALTKTGAYGVQWGNKPIANFYSVYPSLNAKFSGTGENVTAKLHISNEQKSNQSGGTSADMDNVIMYAQTNGANAGETVYLKYIPYSTVFEFTASLEQKSVNSGWGKVKIVSLTLNAPAGTAIAGDFNLKFNGKDAPTITAAGNNSNVISLVPETQPLLNEANKTAKINLAMIPLSDVKNLNGWTVTINVLEGNETTIKTYTKKLDGNYALAPGKIHKISLPKIIPEVAWTYNLNNWIPSLYQYQQIYLTELSLPGAWYAGAPTSDEGYQATESIADLWKAGVRAFATECRTASVMTGFLSFSTQVVISGTGQNGILGLGKEVYVGGTRIAETIKSIAEQISEDEFGVLVLSYADGGEGGHRNEDHQFFINGVKSEIQASGVSNIYAEKITAETTVGNVLGKLIIKINVDDNLTTSSYANDMNALLSYNPFMKQLDSDKFSTPLFSKLYWKEWADTYRTTITPTTTDFLWCFSSANRTHTNPAEGSTEKYDIPTYAQRQTALRAMITRSKEISTKGNHNVWFYFNAGGTQTTSQSSSASKVDAQTFAKTMNPWLLDVITLKSNGGVDTNGSYTGTIGTIVESDPSPLGIVMFNQCTGANDTYKGADIIKAIVDMNDKFTLKRAPIPTMTHYDGAVNNGGNAITTK